MWNLMKFWLDKGVDGFRMDAVPYLVERENTNCENLPETHQILKDLRSRLAQELPQQVSAGGSQPVAAGRDCLFRNGRRVPHGVSLSPHAAHVHGHSAGRPQADH